MAEQLKVVIHPLVKLLAMVYILARIFAIVGVAYILLHFLIKYW